MSEWPLLALAVLFSLAISANLIRLARLDLKNERERRRLVAAQEELEQEVARRDENATVEIDRLSDRIRALELLDAERPREAPEQ